MESAVSLESPPTRGERERERENNKTRGRITARPVVFEATAAVAPNKRM